MTGPVNLSQARKRKARRDKARQAEAGRLAHGAPTAGRALESARRERLAREGEWRRLEKPAPELPDEP